MLVLISFFTLRVKLSFSFLARIQAGEKYKQNNSAPLNVRRVPISTLFKENKRRRHSQFVTFDSYRLTT